jgi:hypothetical protein
METHVAGIGTLMLGAAAVAVGAWPALERRGQRLYRAPGMWSWGSASMLGIAVVGMGLILVGASFIVATGMLARVMVWAGVALALVGGIAYVVNPKAKMRS